MSHLRTRASLLLVPLALVAIPRAQDGPLTPISGCASCTMGVNGVSVPGTYSWVVPYLPALVNTTLSAQGFSFGSTGPCANVLSLTNVIDFTVR
jgi:hypothetical protein